MKIKKFVQRPGPVTILKYVDENTIEINGEAYVFPPEAGPRSQYVSSSPIVNAFRDEHNELHVSILIRSSTLQPGVGDWEVFPQEEAEDAYIELYNEGTD